MSFNQRMLPVLMAVLAIYLADGPKTVSAQVSDNQYQTVSAQYRAQPAPPGHASRAIQARYRRLQAQRVISALSSLAIAAIAKEPHRRNQFAAAAVKAAPEYRQAIARNIAAAYPGFAADIAAAAGANVTQPASRASAAGTQNLPVFAPARTRTATMSRDARYAVGRATTAIAANPAGLESAVAQAVAADPAARDGIVGELSQAFPGFAGRIARAAGSGDIITAQEDTGGNAAFENDEEIDDPFETVNRWVFAFNEGVDFIILRPLAWSYNKLLPDPVILAVRRFFLNLGAPVVFANDLLQADFEDAGVTLGRFGINSTVGLLGFLDVAEGMGLQSHYADFGQTMHRYGVRSGPYLMLPLVGPSSVRDGAGLAVDVALNPLTWLLPSEWNLGLYAGKAVVRREELLAPLHDLKEGSLDYYTSLKSAYHQNRKVELSKSAIDYSRPPGGDNYDKLFDALEDGQ